MPVHPTLLRPQDWAHWYESCPEAGLGGNPTCVRAAFNKRLQAFKGATQSTLKHLDRGTEPRGPGGAGSPPGATLALLLPWEDGPEPLCTPAQFERAQSLSRDSVKSCHAKGHGETQ